MFQKRRPTLPTPGHTQRRDPGLTTPPLCTLAVISGHPVLVPPPTRWLLLSHPPRASPQGAPPSFPGLLCECYSLSRVRLFATPWSVARQAPLSMGFSRQEYWSALPFPSPGDLPDPRIKPGSPALQVDALPAELLWKPQLSTPLQSSSSPALP